MFRSLISFALLSIALTSCGKKSVEKSNVNDIVGPGTPMFTIGLHYRLQFSNTYSALVNGALNSPTKAVCVGYGRLDGKTAGSDSDLFVGIWISTNNLCQSLGESVAANLVLALPANYSNDHVVYSDLTTNKKAIGDIYYLNFNQDETANIVIDHLCTDSYEQACTLDLSGVTPKLTLKP